MGKERFTVAASSLGSYFGVGFNDPIRQLKVDLGLLEDEPDEDSLERMELGNIMEDASLNALEHKLKISIYNRNVEVHDVLSGMLRVKMDGETIYNGEDTVVENKYSNSLSGPFTKNKGYELQVQAYLLHTGYNQAILGGIYQGKVIWRLIKRDEDMINDIKEMVEKVYCILNGLCTEEEFPWHLVEKYSTKTIVKQLDIFDETNDSGYAKRLIDLTAEIKELETEKEAIQGYFKNKYKAVAYSSNEISVSISSYMRTGSIDDVQLMMDYPDINISKYIKPSTEVKTVRITPKRKVA